MLNPKQIYREIEKRRSAIVNKMNAIVKKEDPEHDNKTEYGLWTAAYCQIICYFMDKVFDHDEEHLEFVIKTIRAYFDESKKEKESRNETKV